MDSDDGGDDTQQPDEQGDEQGDESEDSNAPTDHPLDKRCREAHPEHIHAGDITWQRNDIAATRFGETERTLNKRDKLGAPYQYFGGVKYRPLPEFDEFMASGIRRQQPHQREAKRGRRR
jgi:hypothetical protein